MANPGIKTGRVWHCNSCLPSLYSRASQVPPATLTHTQGGRREATIEKLRCSQSFSLRHLDAKEKQQRQTCFLVSCPELWHNKMGSTHLHTHAWAQPHPAEHKSSFTTAGGCCGQARNASPYPKEAVKAEESIYRFNKKCGNLRR